MTMSHDLKITYIIDVAHKSVTTSLQEGYRNDRLPDRKHTKWVQSRTYGGVRGRKTKVGRKLHRFPPTRFMKTACNRKYKTRQTYVAE